MSIVPFVLDGPSRSVVTSSAEFELQGDMVLIKGLERAQLDDPNDSNVTYDLRIGPTYRDHREPSQLDLSPDGVIRLLPGMAVIVATEEEVHFPRSLFGVIVPKVSLLHEGVSNTTSKIDPGYGSGRLYITIFNLGKKPIDLKRGQKICSVFLLKTGPDTRPYNKPSQALRNQQPGGTWDKARFFLETNGSWLTAILTLVTIIATLVTIFATAFTLIYSTNKEERTSHTQGGMPPTRHPSPMGEQQK